MMARSQRSKQKPDTLMQDRPPPTRRNLLATHGRTIHRVRSSMAAWLRRRGSAIRTTRRRRSKRAGYRRIGRPSRPSCGRRIATHAGRSNSARPNRARMARHRQSIWQSRSLAIRTMFRSIAVSASSADGRPQMRLPMRAVVCAKACSTRAIRRAGCGPIPPTDRRPTRRS
jgi:hypothetical protein